MLPLLQKCNIIRQVTWTVELLSQQVRDELGALPNDMKARFRRIAGLIQDYGLEKVSEPYVKHLEGSLISRALYVTARGRRVIVVRVFIRKTQKTPRNELLNCVAASEGGTRLNGANSGG